MMSDLATSAVVALVAVSVLLVIAAGATLARTGDRLAEQTGLDRVFVGALLIAGATSLPELGTGLTAAISDAPDLTIGDLFGASMANMAILAVIDIRHRGRVLPAVELGHTRVAAVAIGLTALAVMSIATPPAADVLGVGITTIGITAVYVAALGWFRRVPPIGSAAPSPTPFRGLRTTEPSVSYTTRALAGRFAAAAGLLLVAAPLLTLGTEALGERYGISQSALGVTVLAVSTALPELTTSMTALRIGAYDLAVGNLFGSNAANMAIIVVIDVAYRPGPILGAVDDSHTVAGTGAILLMALALAAVVSGQTNRADRFEPDSVVLLVAYLATVAAVTVSAST